MFRSKVRWIEDGEKPTKYFFNTEKRNYERKVITKLKVNGGEIITDFRRVNQEIEEFYKTLLSTKEEPGDDDNSDKLFQDFVKNLNFPKLSDEEHQDLEYDISKEELLNVLKGLNDNKTPVTMALPKNFMKPFLSSYAIGC